MRSQQVCGRFNLRTNPDEFAEFFAAHVADNDRQLLLRYNIAPTQPLLAVRETNGQREAVSLLWGLIPSWSKDAKIASRLINARSETAGTKPSFRAAFKRRRCLIPASGFYEWDGHVHPKQPYHITPHNVALMAFAGLWEHWQPSSGEELETCTILTTQANRTIGTIHDRMPVILGPDEYEDWLREDTPPEHLQKLLRPATEDLLDLTPISTAVNNVRHTGPDCIAPLHAS